MSAGKAGPRRPDWATGLLAVSLLVAALAGGVSTEVGELRRLGARPALWGFHPRPEQLVMPLFLHFGWTHWTCNLVSLVLVAGSLEAVSGSVLVMYLFGFSGLASILISLWHAPQAMAVGCSGAVFGLWAARLTHSWWPPREPERYKITLLFAFSLVLTMLPQSLGLPVDSMGHLGGLVAGVVGYAAYRAGKGPRLLAMVALLAWAAYTAREPWMPREF